jgi:hypothetical protein
MARGGDARDHGSMRSDVSPRMLAALTAALLTACQSLPAEEESRARAMVESATLAGMGRLDVTEEVARSQQKLRLARRWIDAGDYGPARWLAEQAEVDAELALARAAAEEARAALAARQGRTRVGWQKP